MTEHLIRTQHGVVAVVDYGGGPDLVLLHGAGRHLSDWALVRPHLTSRRVVAVDFRWHGHSSDEGDVGIEANADDVEVVVAELGLRNPVVAGHSQSIAIRTETTRKSTNRVHSGVFQVDDHRPEVHVGMGVHLRVRLTRRVQRY